VGKVITDLMLRDFYNVMNFEGNIEISKEMWFQIRILNIWVKTQKDVGLKKLYRPIYEMREFQINVWVLLKIIRKIENDSSYSEMRVYNAYIYNIEGAWKVNIS